MADLTLLHSERPKLSHTILAFLSTIGLSIVEEVKWHCCGPSSQREDGPVQKLLTFFQQKISVCLIMKS